MACLRGFEKSVTFGNKIKNFSFFSPKLLDFCKIYTKSKPNLALSILLYKGIHFDIMSSFKDSNKTRTFHQIFIFSLLCDFCIF